MKQRIHFVRDIGVERTLCGLAATDDRPLVFWDLRLWDSEYMIGHCRKCRELVEARRAALQSMMDDRLRARRSPRKHGA